MLRQSVIWWFKEENTKLNVPLRSIISGTETFCHATAKYLTTLLAPLAKNDYTVRGTFSFVDELVWH